MSSEVSQWYGELPAQWDLVRFKFVARVRNGQVDPTSTACRDLPLYAPNHIESSTGRLFATDSAGEQGAESGKYPVRMGEIVYSKIRPALRKLAVAPRDGLCSADMYAIAAVAGMETKFLFWAMLGEPFYAYTLLSSDRVAMPKINREALAEVPLPKPPASVQHAIADFLDRKTAAIDALIAKKERLIELLEEKRQALITQAVTKGLDPSVPMKDSGIEWLGPIPAHWDVARIKYVAKLESGHTPNKETPEYWAPDGTEGIPWVSLNDTKALSRADYIAETAYHITEAGIANSSARMLPARVVVFTRDATVGEAAITTVPATVSQHIIAWVCGPDIVPEYLLHVFYGMREELDRRTMGATLKTIGLNDVKALTTPLPSRAEQEHIVAHIRSQLETLRRVEERVFAQLDRLREYRQALITAAVTGKIDVTAEAG